LLLQASGDAQDGGDGVLSGSHWQGWLRDWEERQSAQLDVQRRVIVGAVEETRDVILEHSEQSITKQMTVLRNELRSELELERSIRYALQAAVSSSPDAFPRSQWTQSTSQWTQATSQWTQDMTNGQTFPPKPAKARTQESISSINNGKKLRVRFEDEDVETKHQQTRPSTTTRLPFTNRATTQHMEEAFALAVGAGKGSQSNASSFFDDVSADAGHFGPIAYKVSFEPRLQCQKALAKVVHTHAFNIFATGMIILYSLAIGVQSQLEMEQAMRRESSLQWSQQLDMCFTLLFAAELSLRMACELDWFFCGPGMAWNWFDLFVVTCNLVEMANILDVNLGFLRVFRALRAARALRLMRIFRVFRELRLMTASIMASMRSLVWAFLLMLIVMYIFAVILLQGAGDFMRQSLTRDENNLHDLIGQELETNFATILKTTYSLTQAISGGRSWGEYADIFLEINPLYGVVFGVFIVFMVFGVLNILTGVFVESTRNLASFDQDLVIQEELSLRESTINQIRALFGEIDTDKSGTISMKELKENLDDERVKAYFGVLQMDVSEAEGLFSLLDKDGSGEVSIMEFIMSCMRLKGQARSIDMASMMYESKRLYRMVNEALSQLDSDVKNLALQIHTSQAMQRLEAMDTCEGAEHKAL